MLPSGPNLPDPFMTSRPPRAACAPAAPRPLGPSSPNQPPGRSPTRPISRSLARSAVAVAFGSLLLAGCGTTWRAPDAGALAPAQRATLELAGDRIGLAVVNIDNRSPGAASVRRFELAPGEHTVVANLQSVSSEPIVLEFTAEAGRRYTLQSEVVDGTSYVFRWRAEIRDDATRQPVSTQVGKERGPIRAQR